MPAEVLSHCGNNGLQIEVVVRDVNREHAIGPEMSLVDLESFFGQQMHRDGITAEGVQCDEIKLLRRFLLQREPGIT